MISSKRSAVLASFLAATMGFAGACSSSAGSAGSGGSAQTPRATGDPVSAQSTSLGTILVDGRGRTVYVFANDKANVSTCDGACTADWPPVAAPSKLPASLPGVSGALATTTRSDGSHQLTVSGHPVYTFSGDSAPGQTTGQGITLNGGLWTVVLPSGAPDASPKGGSTPASVPGY
jgi:predicted lipoprotein with Yx(FWY)xxD motif